MFILVTLGTQRILSHVIADLTPSNIRSWTILEWNKLDLTLHKSSYKKFRNSLFFCFFLPNTVYDIHNVLGFCLLTILRLGLNHLKDQKFNHNFKNCDNTLCTCSLEIESTSLFFLHCIHYNNNEYSEGKKVMLIQINPQ